MKKLITYSLLLLSIQLSYCQNLVPNPSFELYSSCPDSMSQITKCTGWENAIPTSADYFNCGFLGNIPSFSGAHNGTGFTRMIGWPNGINVSPYTYLELIQTKLTTPMIAGKTYKISFYASSGDIFIISSPNPCFDIGIYFFNSASPPTLPSGWGCTTITPQVKINSSALTSSYQQYSFCYTPTVNCDKIIIGPFCNNNTPSCPSSLFSLNLGLDDVSITDADISLSLPDTTTICQGQTTILDGGVTNATYQWSGMSNATTQFISASLEGKYKVTVDKNSCTASDSTYLKVIAFDDVLTDTIKICPTDSILLDGKNNYPNINYSWKYPNGTIKNTKTINVNQQGKYTLTLSNNSCTYKDSIYIDYKTTPTIYTKDTTICNGNILQLDAKNNGAIYKWSTGETTQQIIVNSGGIYTVNVTLNSCSNQSTYKVKGVLKPILNLEKEIILCEGSSKKLAIYQPYADSIIWNNGFADSILIVTNPGIYWVKVTVSPCNAEFDSITIKLDDCLCDIYIPESFTPNKDGLNDWFAPQTMCELKSYEFTIFDRWGKKIFASDNLNDKWDGKKNNEDCPIDVYVYKFSALVKDLKTLRYKNTERIGNVTLIR